MENDPFFTNLEQKALSQSLYTSDRASIDADDLPILWEAAEALTSPDLHTRKRGLERLNELNAAYTSPLTGYLLFTRLAEPDLALRTLVIHMIAGVLSSSDNRRNVSNQLRQTLCAQLAQMRTRQIFSLLQVLEFDSATEPKIVMMLSTSSYAGRHLAEILMDRQLPLEIRKKAAYLIGKIGYVDTTATLERFASRLEARVSANKDRSPDANSNGSAEISLLPMVQEALTALKAP